MKKILLSGALTLGGLFVVTTLQAQNQAYFFDQIGEVMGVSDNGKYIAISDDDDHNGYLWNIDNPDQITDITIRTTQTNLPSGQTITGVAAMDCTDDGMVVGSVFYKDGKQKASIYVNGEWKQLPLHEHVYNNTLAVAVTPDGKTIAGYQFIYDETSEIGGRYYPCQWYLNEEGEYDLNCYTDIDLPAHQGFITITQNPEGTIIGGRLFCGAGSTIPVLLNNGELQYFDELETRLEEFYYKDKLIGVFEEYYIDGYKDGATGDYFDGGFDNCDANGNFYGMRTRVFDVTEEGGGRLVKKACIYNVNTGEWIDSETDLMYTAGIGTDLLYTDSATVIEDGVSQKVTKAYGFTAPRSITAIAKISSDARILGGICQEIHPATGEPVYYPFAVVLEKSPVSGVEVVMAAERVPVILSAGRIDVANGAEAEVYTLDGKLAGRGASVSVQPGIYVVTVEGSSVKVAVK